MSALELRLPDMMMRVNEAGRDNFINAVNNFGSSVRLNSRFDFDNSIPANEDVCNSGPDVVVVVFIMN